MNEMAKAGTSDPVPFRIRSMSIRKAIFGSSMSAMKSGAGMAVAGIR
jgi:hypothetical protein